MKPVAALQGAALVCGRFLGRTGWAKHGRAVRGLSHPMMPPSASTFAAGKRGTWWLSFGWPKRWTEDEARCFLSQLLLGFEEEAGLTLGASPCLVVSHEGYFIGRSPRSLQIT